jgi:hypothetical protein
MGIYRQARWAFGPEYKQKKAQLIDSLYSIAQGTILVVFRRVGDVSTGKGAEYKHLEEVKEFFSL